MKLRTVIVCLLLSISGFAQTGNYFLSHFSPDEERFNITCFDIVQDDRGVFYFATQAGVLQFDGRNWDIIKTQGTLYSIARTPEGQIYVAGSEGFGRISRDDLGMEIYEPLFTQSGTEYIFQIVTLGNYVYFLSEQTVFEYSVITNEIRSKSRTDQTGSFVGLHEIFEKPLVSSESRGLFLANEEPLSPVNFGVPDSVTLIFAHRYENQYLLGTDENRIFLYEENQVIKEVKLQDAAYANASVVINATWVNEKLIALGTLRGGVMFINPATGVTEEIINYNTGLPDNEIFALITDKNQNVWAAHAYGFTRIAPFLPFRSFRYYPGLKGNLLCATTHKGTVYVGTSVGLFELKKEEFFDEITYFVEVPVKVQPGKKKQEVQPVVVVEEQETKKGFFGFLKRKKKEAESGVTTPQGSTQTAPNPKRQFKREKRTRKILRESFFVYKPVEGIDSKVTQLLHWHDKLIAAGLGGVYEVSSKAKTLVQEPIRFLLASEKFNRFIASTYDDKLHQYSFVGGELKEGEPIADINGPVNYIFEEGTAALWFCGFDKLFRLALNDTTDKLKILSVAKHNFDQLLGISLNKQVFIAASSGFYFYDEKSSTLVEGDTLRKPIAYFANASNLWFRDKHSWYTAGESGGHNNLQLLNLFNNIRSIDTDLQRNSLWIITGNNELLQFNSEVIRKDEVVYPLILKSIENNNILIPKRSLIKINQDQSSIKIEVVRPDFIGARFIEYRYQLEGLKSQWSDWEVNNNEVNFPYLPVGKYRLLVQSRDIFGRTNELEPVNIEVVPPYWKQTWFYAAEFSVFLFLVILSFRLSYRFIFLSRVLSLLSIIIFIEFIQTMAGSTFSTKDSPVFDFVIQVAIALMILPVEGFLRRHFLQAIVKRNQVKLEQTSGTAEVEIPKSTKRS